MPEYSSRQFGDTVLNDFNARRGGYVFDKSIRASGTESKALGHPGFADIAIGTKHTASLVAVFLDLSDFTGRTFWDEQSEVVDLAHAVLTGFIETISVWRGHPLGLRGDGLFAGFGPGDPQVVSVLALSACAFALDAVEREVNPRLENAGIAPVRARAGLDYGPLTFVRSGSVEHSEVNPIGFAANFAAKCEKKADSWEILIGEGLANQLPDAKTFVEHDDSPTRYQRDYQTREYRFYDYRWRRTLQHIPGTLQQINEIPIDRITIS